MLFLRKYHERAIIVSSGKEDGESKTYQASHLEAQTVTLNSQGDTNLIGSQVAGNKVNANVGGKFNIESLQDEERFKTKSSGGGLEVEFGFGNNWSLSGYGNASKGTTHRKQVNEQAGIFAEDGGYHINADSVHLKGGAIASTNPKNSELATNKLTFEEIQNESSSSAASASISGSLKESKEKWVDNETGRAVKPNTENSTKLDSQRSGGISPGLPMFEQDSDSSVTRATLTEGTIILNKDTHPTVTTAKELGINTDLAQANNQVAQTKDVKAQIQEQQQISTAIGNVKSAVDTYTSNKQEEAEQEVRRLKSRLEKAKQQGNQETVNQLKKDLMQAEAQAENWGTGGSTKRAVDAITNAGLIALSGGSSQSIATAAASPYVNQLIKKATEDYPALNIPTHILWGAVEAELMGGKASTGAISTAAGELGAKYLTEHLYNKEAKDLTETERNQVKEMAKALAGVAGGLAAAGQGASAVKILSESSIGTTVAHNAVENNLLSKNEDEELFNISEKFEKAKELKQKEKNRGGELLKKDSYINFLIRLNQKDPSQLTEAQKNYLAVELHKIARSWNVPVSDLYNWDFSKEIKRNDSALTKYLSDEIKFWDSYVGKQAQSFAIGALAAGGGVAAVRVIPKAAGYLQETAVLSARNPVAAEMLVTGGYKAGEISYKAHSGQYKTEDELKSAVYDGAKDVIKVPLLSKLKPGAQALNSFAFDLMYEVNKPGATDRQIKTEMIGSSAGSGFGFVAETISNRLGFPPLPKTFLNTIGGAIVSDKAKETYQDVNKEKK